MKRGVAFLAAAVCAQAACAAGQQEARGAGPRQERQAMVALVPKGYQIQIQLDDTLDSRTTRVGERVHARLLAPIDAGGRTIVPAGTRLLGTVTEVKSPTAGLLKAGIKFKIEAILPREGAVPIEASAHLDVNDLAMKGGKMAGTMAAKEVAKSFIPVLGTVYLIQNIASGVQFITEEKEITIPAGTQMKLWFDAETRIPAGR